ncbi:MAG: outer membrane beta-barrel protein [Myxococcales bacterium]|nr:outer membrane beta-barrel protein [Myxococcales bacterium]
MFTTRPAVTVAFLGTLLATPVALADGAPGSCDCAVTPPAAAPAPAPRLARWGVGVHLASITLPDPTGMDDGGTSYGGGGLQLRYRLSPRWQLELSAAHAQEQDVDASVARQLDSVAISALYHLRPFARWDVYLVAGLGATSDGDPDATDEARQASQMGDVRFGGGVERRIGKIGVGAELRAIVVGQREPDATARMAGAPAAAEPQRGGGALTLGATYYF